MAENTGDLVVETSQLTKIYRNRQIALNDIGLQIESGSVVGLLGPNGAGKTTLLRLILGLHRPTSGLVKVFGKKMTPNAAYLRSRIGYIPTNPQFPPGMTPITYLDYMAKLFGLPINVRKPRLATLLRAVDLMSVSGESIAGFSNGMTARLAVATSLINEPELLIWDEPTHGLDPEARRSMLELINSLAEEKTIIVSSHNLADIDEVCSHAVVLSHGQLIFSGTLSELKGKMRRSHFQLDLEGDSKALAKSAQSIQDLAEVRKTELRQRKMEIILNDEQSSAAALASIFMTLADNKITVISIKSLGYQTEQAFLSLIGKEVAKGFSRAHSSTKNSGQAA